MRKDAEKENKRQINLVKMNIFQKNERMTQGKGIKNSNYILIRFEAIRT